MRGIERAAEAGQHLVDLAFCDDEGRREGDPIADDAQHEAVLVPDAIDDFARAPGRRVAGPRALVLDEFDAGDQADAGDVADQRMPGELAAGRRSCGGRGAAPGR